MKASVVSYRIAALMIVLACDVSCRRRRPKDKLEEEDAEITSVGRTPNRRMNPKMAKGNLMNYVNKMEEGKCMLENEMVSITDQLPENDKSAYFPTCVKVRRCKGCCMGNRHCQATSSQKKSFQIGRTDFNGPAVSVEVTEDVGCSCDCKITKENCPASVAKFDPMECTCVCRNIEDEIKCLEKMYKTHKWETASCSCKCRTNRICSTGEEFSLKSCKCVAQHAGWANIFEW